VKHYIPERGHIVWLDFDPQLGREQAGRRPSLVLSPKSYNKAAQLILCVPITSKIKGYPFEVTLPEDSAVKGVILADQVKSFDWTKRKAKFIGSLPLETLQEVFKKLASLL
jgi:mRNA interferase MazF